MYVFVVLHLNFDNPIDYMIVLRVFCSLPMDLFSVVFVVGITRNRNGDSVD